jgi:purine catabolism regulator
VKIRIAELLESKYFQSSTVLAGEKGLSNLVSYVQVLECMDTLKFLRGGELLLNSVYNFLGKDDEQRELIEGLSKNGAAGLCVPANYLIDHLQLPPALEETANKLDFPIISFPEGYLFGEICEYVNNYYYSPITKHILRENEVIRDMYAQTYKEGLSGMTKSLYEWTGMDVSIIYEGEILSFPSEKIDQEILLDPKQWLLVDDKNLHFKNINHYQYRDKNQTFEWLGAKIPVPSAQDNYVLLFLNNIAYTQEDELLLSASLSACAMEIKRIKNLSEIKRIYRKDLLENILNNTLELSAAQHQVNLLGYSLPSEGSVAVISIQSKTGATSLDDCLLAFDDILSDTMHSIPFWVQLDDKKFVILAFNNEDSSIERFHAILCQRFPDLDIVIGLGNKKDYSEYNISYAEANQALEVGKCLDQPLSIYDFRELGFYGFVNLPENRNVVVSYHSTYIEPLKKKFKNKYLDEIMDTLTSYIECRYHYLKTAEKMHLHRNTVTYRIGVIEKACNIDFQNHEDCFNMSIALKLLPLMKAMDL